MGNSPLVSFTRISPNKTSPRNHKIDTITIHCVVGQLSVESLGATFASSDRQASSNYGIGSDGRVGMYVEEKDRSWCSSNRANDQRAITIEVASDSTYPYAVNDAAYKTLIDLLVDICQRNGIKQLLWKNDKSLIGQVDKQNMTVHRWFAAKECPGEYLFSRHAEIASEVNARLGVTEVPETPDNSDSNKADNANATNVPFTVNVAISDLQIRKGPGIDYAKTGEVTGNGIFTIVEVKNGWGQLKSGAGWIPLNLVNPSEDTSVKPTEPTENIDTKNYTKIEGTAVATAEQMIAYIRSKSPNVVQSVAEMIPFYIFEGMTEGIAGDVAFAQSCIETGNFSFPQSTCAVTIDQNNFAMMGVTSTFAKGETFETPQLGIRAQIQHLKAYASTEPLSGECVDPRFKYVSRGCAPYVEWLGQKENPQGKGWAVEEKYGEKILKVLKEIRSMKVTEELPDDSTNGNKQEIPYLVKVSIPNLNIRKGPGIDCERTGLFTGIGVFTIVEIRNGIGSNSGWGKLKSGAGWISLDCTKKA